MSPACDRLAHDTCAGCTCICHLDALDQAGVDIILEELA